jgi:cell wall-associated NlpC family hydrolase
LILFVMFIAVIANAAMAALFSGGGDTGAVGCHATGAPTNGVSGYSTEQSANAATIVAVGKRMHVPEHGQVIAIAAALQESGLRNLDHGDRDSLGLFQQRPSQGWGTAAQIMNPGYAATAFYSRLLEVPDWQRMSVNDAAQAVQRSATPIAYGRHELAARALTAAVSDATCATLRAPDQAAAQAIAFAHAQTGQPYLWGGDGPELTELPNGQAQVTGGFDCSGLTKAAYAAAGIEIPRTAQTQFDAGPMLPAGQPVVPGDLVFFGDGPDAVTHVGIAISSAEMINAPHRGALVRVDSIWRPSYLGATRPAAG